MVRTGRVPTGNQSMRIGISKCFYLGCFITAGLSADLKAGLCGFGGGLCNGLGGGDDGGGISLTVKSFLSIINH